MGQRPTAGTSKVIQRPRRQKKTGQQKKHPTKLVKAATCCLLSPLTTTMGWKLRGMIYVGNKEMNEKHLEYVMKNSNAIYLVL